MEARGFWLRMIESAWTRSPICWLYGARGVGKSFLCQNIPESEYFNCELPGMRREMENAEEFLKKWDGNRVILDDIHRLPNRLEILDAARGFPNLKILAAAPFPPAAFGKTNELIPERARVHLTPLASQDMLELGRKDISHRLLRGGLPAFFLSPIMPEAAVQEWMDFFWAKDIQEVFRLYRRNSLHKFLELLLKQSGGYFEATRFTGPTQISRTAITKYFSILELAGAVRVIRPFSARRPTEIISLPKIYAFDTGFFCFFRGWRELREEDYQPLWEHYVLNEMDARLQGFAPLYWRDKRDHLVHFVLVERGLGITAVLCQWRAEEFRTEGLRAFRYQYPQGPNWVVVGNVPGRYSRSFGNMEVEFIGLEEFGKRLDNIRESESNLV